MIQVILSGMAFGILGAVGKSLFALGMTSGELLALRFGLAALVLWPVILIRYPGRWRLPARQVGLCAALGIGGYALFSTCFFMALQGLSASLAVLLLYTYPVIVMAVAWVAWGERVPARKLPAVPLTLLGLVLLVWGEFSVGRLSALFLGVGSAVFYSVYILVSSRALRRVEPLVSVTYILSFAGLALGLLHLHDGARILSLVRAGWPEVLAMVLVGTVGAMTLFLVGLQKLKPWEVSLLSMAEPVTGVLIALVFLGEHLSVLQGLGAAGVLGGMAWVSLPERRAPG
jgi:drug/metabolite transporter (DMT)-like permease